MLVLSRKLNESIIIDGAIRVTVLGMRGNHVRIGIEAPDHIGIYREELCVPVRSVDEARQPSLQSKPIGSRSGSGEEASRLSRIARWSKRDKGASHESRP